MEMLFHWAGPPSKRMRDAADLFIGQDASGQPRRLPWIDLPTKVEGAEQVFTREEIVLWLARAAMPRPLASKVSRRRPGGAPCCNFSTTPRRGSAPRLERVIAGLLKRRATTG